MSEDRHKQVRSQSVSVITVTRGRVESLEKLLFSLSKQIILPLEVILVVNDQSSDQEQLLSAQFNNLRISINTEPRIGIPIARNTGTRHAHGDILAFIDDDCVALLNWVQQIELAHASLSEKYIIQGKSVSLPRENFYAKITSQHYKNWLASQLSASRDCSTFDTKNLSLKRSVFKYKRNLFNEKLRYGSDDIELGFRLRQNGYRIIYDSSIVVQHYERTTYLTFIHQHLRFAMGEAESNRLIQHLDLVRMFPRKKMALHVKSIFFNLTVYIQSLQFIQMIRYILVIISLFFVRTLGYLFGLLLSRKLKQSIEFT